METQPGHPPPTLNHQRHPSTHPHPSGFPFPRPRISARLGRRTAQPGDDSEHGAGSGEPRHAPLPPHQRHPPHPGACSRPGASDGRTASRRPGVNSARGAGSGEGAAKTHPSTPPHPHRRRLFPAPRFRLGRTNGSNRDGGPIRGVSTQDGAGRRRDCVRRAGRVAVTGTARAGVRHEARGWRCGLRDLGRTWLGRAWWAGGLVGWWQQGGDARCRCPTTVPCPLSPVPVPCPLSPSPIPRLGPRPSSRACRVRWSDRCRVWTEASGSRFGTTLVDPVIRDSYSACEATAACCRECETVPGGLDASGIYGTARGRWSASGTPHGDLTFAWIPGPSSIDHRFVLLSARSYRAPYMM